MRDLRALSIKKHGYSIFNRVSPVRDQHGSRIYMAHLGQLIIIFLKKFNYLFEKAKKKKLFFIF